MKRNAYTYICVEYSKFLFQRKSVQFHEMEFELEIIKRKTSECVNCMTKVCESAVYNESFKNKYGKCV